MESLMGVLEITDDEFRNALSQFSGIAFVSQRVAEDHLGKFREVRYRSTRFSPKALEEVVQMELHEPVENLVSMFRLWLG